MINICILVDDSNVERSRKIGRHVLSNPLRIPLSTNGKLPATHWFCSLKVTEDGYNEIMNLQKFSTIERLGPKEFLQKWNLQIIK
jgi:hypothetical protein